jgi:hypothetical protein
MQPKANETLARVVQPLVAAAARHRKPVKQEIRDDLTPKPRNDELL